MSKQNSGSTGHKDASLAIGKVRWSIAVLLGVGILINYIDRLSLALVATPMTHEFGLTATDFGIIGSAFVWSYALMQIPSGILLDRIGSKWIWRIGMATWAIASFLTAVASGYWVIILARLLLGLAEAPAFPGAMKATGTWFPLTERSLATAVFDAGTRLANVIGL
ncbi:MAG: MFS transporter, partial [Candidimonas sp.]